MNCQLLEPKQNNVRVRCRQLIGCNEFSFEFIEGLDRGFEGTNVLFELFG